MCYSSTIGEFIGCLKPWVSVRPLLELGLFPEEAPGPPTQEQHQLTLAMNPMTYLFWLIWRDSWCTDHVSREELRAFMVCDKVSSAVNVGTPKTLLLRYVRSEELWFCENTDSVS